MHDVLTAQVSGCQQLQSALTGSFERYGYIPIALPLVEHSELYLRRSGENIISQMYEFQHRGRRLCLRPEMTASTMRAYIEHLQGASLPVRLYYTGPVFRHNGPSRGAHRQFTQVGLELIGADGALADGEVIRAAGAALEAAGLSSYSLLLGHVGILSAFLNRLDIDGQLRSFLLLNMETLRQRGEGYVAERLSELYPAFRRPSAPDGPAASGGEHLFHALRGVPAGEARGLIVELLESLSLKLDENRDRDEVAERLLTKLRRGDQTAALDTALEFMARLGQLKGQPAAVLAECDRLLRHYHMNNPVTEYISRLLSFLDTAGFPADRISLDLGISLGFQYYTGMIFEIHHTAAGGSVQLCGGGRYDDLIGLLGGRQPQPATGFSFGLETVYSALQVEKGLNTASDGGYAPQIFVTGVDQASLPDAVRAAETVRADGWRAELGLCPRTPADSLLYARGRHIPLAVLINSADHLPATVHDLSTGQQHALRLDDLLHTLHSIGCQHA